MDSEQQLLLSEWFYTIQGEGPSVGIPAVFFRFGYCNLRCVWCDSKYTWDAQHYDLAKEICNISVNEITQKWWPQQQIHPTARIVLTGGEPLLRLHAEGQKALIKEIIRLQLLRPLFVEVETAGTCMPSDFLLSINAQFNVSPKLASSDNPIHKRLVPNVLKFFAMRSSTTFKFVVTSPSDIEEIQDYYVKSLGISPCQIILMPEGVNEQQLAEKRKWVFNVCKEKGYRYGDRIHIIIFGQKRGV